MKKTVSMQRLLAALLAVLLLCPMAACKKQEVDIGQWETKEIDRISSFFRNERFYDADGNYFETDDVGLEHRPLVICFWKMDRPESLNALPAFQKAFERYGDKAQFLMICTYSENDGNGSEDTKQWIEEKGYTFPVFYDRDQVLQGLRVEKFPYILFLEKSHEIVHVRNEALSEGEIDTLIADILE